MIAELKPYAEYKESGLPWFGQMPNHWAQSKGPRLRLISSALMRIDHDPYFFTHIDDESAIRLRQSPRHVCAEWGFWSAT